MATISQRYHSDLKKEYTSGKLSAEIAKTIPRSTRQRWREKERKSFWMPISIEHNVSDSLKIRKLLVENKRLKAKLRALYYMAMLYKGLVASLPLKRTQMRTLYPVISMNGDGNRKGNHFY